MTLTVNMACSFKARAKSTTKRLDSFCDAYHADVAHPLAYRCLRCKLIWDCSPLDDYRQVVCSGCYGENVMLTRVRLGFYNWGKANGGEKDQWARYELACIEALEQAERLRGAK